MIDRAEASRFQQQAVVATADRLAPPFIIDPPDLLHRRHGEAPPVARDGARLTLRIEFDAQALGEVEGT